MFGLTPDIIRNIKEIFSRFSQIDKAILYGSRAKGNYKDGSDIDITLLGENLNLKIVYALETLIDELYLPYTFDISIFAQIDNDDLIEHILSVGKVFYLRENGLLPEGWVVKRLGEFCEIKPPKKRAKEKLSENDLVTFFPMTDLKEFNHYINPIKTKFLKDVYGGYVYFENNDVLLAKITPCFENGKLGIAKNLKNGIGFGSSEYIVFRAKDGILPEYIYYFLSLEKIRREGKGKMTGAVGHKRIPVVYLSNHNLIIPPLPEQKRIVATLDKAFTAIDKAKANAEQNLKNTKELFESYLQGVFENKGDGWVENSLGEIADIEYGYTAKSNREGDYRYIRITDIDKNGELILERKKYIKYSKEAEKFSAEENDLLMARTGATFAKVLLYKAYEPSIFASYLIRIKLKEKIKNEL
jgi:type I restriction enzyme, S subunit